MRCCHYISASLSVSASQHSCFLCRCIRNILPWLVRLSLESVSPITRHTVPYLSWVCPETLYQVPTDEDWITIKRKKKEWGGEIRPQNPNRPRLKHNKQRWSQEKGDTQEVSDGWMDGWRILKHNMQTLKKSNQAWQIKCFPNLLHFFLMYPSKSL